MFLACKQNLLQQCERTAAIHYTSSPGFAAVFAISLSGPYSAPFLQHHVLEYPINTRKQITKHHNVIQDKNNAVIYSISTEEQFKPSL
jgi:hypothetical protein